LLFHFVFLLFARTPEHFPRTLRFTQTSREQKPGSSKNLVKDTSIPEFAVSFEDRDLPDRRRRSFALAPNMGKDTGRRDCYLEAARLAISAIDDLPEQ
jgi:hypothetical protein